jgi:hypothetical protein
LHRVARSTARSFLARVRQRLEAGESTDRTPDSSSRGG